MKALVFLLGAGAVFPGAFLLSGCGPGENGTESESSGGSNVAPEGEECGVDLALAAQLGEGVGAAFAPYEEGDPLPLEFASQAGLEAPVSVRLTGIDPDEIDTLELQILVEGDPIGDSSTSSNALRCEGEESARVDTSIPIDVTQHPSVASVAQLDGREALLVLSIVDADGVLLEESVEVTLQP